MKIAVTGSIATDHLMTFRGRFRDSLVVEQLDKISLSFLVDELEIRRGGVAANIAFGMANLGQRPSSSARSARTSPTTGPGWSATGSTASRSTSATRGTRRGSSARPTTTWPRSRRSTPARCPTRGSSSWARSPTASAGSTSSSSARTTRRRCSGTPRSAGPAGIPFIADPSQQLAFADGPEIRRLVDGAAYLFTNEYEAHLTEQKTGWSADEITRRVDVRIITRGSEGVTIHRKGEDVISVPVAREVRKADPTGVGDAFRAGFLTGLSGGLDLRRCAELGSMLATYVIETVGTQEYQLGQEHFLSRLADAYGADSADEISPVVACRHG